MLSERTSMQLNRWQKFNNFSCLLLLSLTHSLSIFIAWIVMIFFFIICCAFLVVSELCAKFFMHHRQKGRFSLTKKLSAAAAVLDVAWELIMHKHTKKDANFVVTHPCVHYLLKFPSTQNFCMLKHVLQLNNLHITKKSFGRYILRFFQQK